MTGIKKFICKYFGHNFEVYPSDRDRFEMAGYCKRCGYDTHNQGEDGMNDEKAIRKLKREKAFWKKVSSVLLTRTGIIDREYVDNQLSEIEAKIKEEKMK